MIALVTRVMARRSMTPANEEGRREIGATQAGMKSKAQALAPGGAGIGGQRAASSRRLTAADKVICLPRSELERAGQAYNHCNRKRNGACHCW